jgi:chromosomal replication initiation ATPase DnaA
VDRKTRIAGFVLTFLFSEYTMKNTLLAFLAGSAMTFAFSAFTAESSTEAVAVGPLFVTVHDAAGKTFQIAAAYNFWQYNNNALTIDYDSDQFLCSGFQ